MAFSVFGRRPGRGCVHAGALIAAGSLSAAASVAAAAEPHTIGLVMSSFRYGLYETANAKEECPEGFQFKQMDQYRAQFPTPEARRAQEEKFGYYTNRGPNGENVFHFPWVIQDPLPFRPMASKVAYGLDLDRDGGASDQDFTSPEGERGVDNQLYRVVGCIPGWRKGGMIDGLVSTSILSEHQTRVVLEVQGVDSEVDDPEVTVVTYRGLDPIGQDNSGKPVPWLTQRVDYKKGARYIHRMKGRIVGGVLMTEPADVILPSYEQPDLAGDRDIRGMQLRLKLTPEGAQGLMGGYVDIAQWYTMFARTWGAGKIADIQSWSGPATYQALRRYADYREPGATEATAISAAYQVGFGRVFVIHDPGAQTRLAKAMEPSR